MNDMLLDLPASTSGGADYTAHDIEVLEGLEPVRRRPGMYIGGTDERSLHHLVAEVLDNAMDEAVAGHASRIELELLAPDRVLVRDNGRGIPVDPHPKFPKKSALEVILTTLHSGGKFGSKAYETSGGLHGVGVSVVNALASELTVEVARNKKLYVAGLPPGRAAGPRARGRRGAEPARHHRRLHARPRDLRPRRPLPARPAAPHGAQQGLPLPRGRDPLALRPRAGAARPGRAGRRDLPLPGRPRRLPQGPHRRPRAGGRGAVRRRGGARGRRQGRVGGGLAGRRGGLRRLLLQHRPYPPRRHARDRPARGAPQGPAGARGADRLQEGRPA